MKLNDDNLPRPYLLQRGNVFVGARGRGVGGVGGWGGGVIVPIVPMTYVL